MKTHRLSIAMVPLIAGISFILFSCQPPAALDFTQIAEPVVSPGWIYFKPEVAIDPQTLFKDYAAAFHLSKGTEMVIRDEDTDSLDITLYRYAQFFRNIEVEDAAFLVRAKAGRAISANGRLAHDFEPEVTAPGISEEAAWKIVSEHIPAERYYREDSLQASIMNPSLTNNYRPVGKLLFTRDTGDEGGRRLLAWVFQVYVHPFDNSRSVYINAADGSILKEIPLLPTCFAGSGPVTFRGTQNLNTQKTGNRFLLTDDCNDNLLHARLLDNEGKVINISDDDNNWAGNNPSLVTSYWGLGVAYDYFRLIHNRKGYDGKNGNISIFNDPAMMNNGHNATGGGGGIRIGLANLATDNDDYNCLDIIGHEYMHNVIETSAKLGYDATLESSALNESFSDIFGQMVEQWIEGSAQPEWVIADDKGCGPPFICRDLKNPKAYNQPDTYKGNFWQTTDADPHANGSVQNRWYALLTDGGAGTNELSQQFNITGIGMVKARKIAWRTLTRYLYGSADYNDARNGSIDAAADLYGENSVEKREVTKAWCAVGLCPYVIPGQADVFDRPNGNPNPASPNNNNSLVGATPLGTGNFLWSSGNFTQLKIEKLSIFPAGDVDYFNIRFPEVDALGGRCFVPGFSFVFGTEVNARIFLSGQLHKTFTNVSYFSINLGEAQASDFVLEIKPAFPGQVVEYKLSISFFSHIDPLCFQTVPPNRWEEIRNCPMCDVKILRGIDFVILEPLYRTENQVAIKDHYFYWNGEGSFEVPVRLVQGNNLNAELVNASGKTVASSRTGGNRSLLLQAGQLPAGAYSLRFSGFGNGTQLQVLTPER